MYPVIDVKRTGQRIKELMYFNNLTPKDIQEYLSLSCVQSIYRWLNGVSVPNIDNLYALSGLFHVTIDNIVQGNRESSYYHIIKELDTLYNVSH